MNTGAEFHSKVVMNHVLIIGVKSVDNQGVFNVDGHTDTNVGNSIEKYQTEYVHVNKFAPLAVADDSFAFDTNSSVNRLGDVDAPVVETRADVKSKCHNSINHDNIHGVLVKGQWSRDQYQYTGTFGKIQN